MSKDRVLAHESFRNFSEFQLRTLDQIIDHEGVRLQVYHDTEGKLTAGVGHLITQPGWLQEEVTLTQVVRWLREDFLDAEIGSIQYCPKPLSEPRRAVLIGMAFNLGLGGLYRFVRLREALFKNDWRQASIEMVDSLWAGHPGERGVGFRAWKMAAQMRLDRWIH